MKLVKPSAKIIKQQPGLDGIYKQIELAGRTCYKSEDKITEDSAKAFVDRMIKSGHIAMLEHGTIYLTIPDTGHENNIGRIIANNKYTKCNYNDYTWYITTNLRVLVENGWMDDLKYLCEPTEYHERRVTFKLVTSIGVTRELNRHRVNSIAEQSTRYCNYSKDKFGNEVTFCIPSWIDYPECDGLTYDYINQNCIYNHDIYPLTTWIWLYSCAHSEELYLQAIDEDWQPQQAREILPLCTATEIVHTAFESDWNHFFDLRYFESTGKVHPNMLELTTLMKKEYDNRV